MNNKVLLYSCFILLGTFISSISQVLLKISANKKYESKIKEYLNPLVISAYTMFVISTFLSIFAYKEVLLSMGPVLEATSYIYVTFFGVKVFKEKINRRKIISLCLIIIGIMIYSLLG